MKRWLIVLVVAAAIAAWRGYSPPAGEQNGRGATATSASPAAGEGSSAADDAFEQRRSGVIMSVEGTVQRLLGDDTQGSRHQRFIIRLPSGLTLLVAHNIDLAPRVAGLQAGAGIRLRGEYEWNDRGGVVHWTHRDPQGEHEPGWIEYDGTRYD